MNFGAFVCHCLIEIVFFVTVGVLVLIRCCHSALAMPPGPVKLTLEAVAYMMGEGASATSWIELRKFVQRKDFISLIVNYDSATLTPALRDKVACGFSCVVVMVLMA